jgi:hypothetical protein
LKQNPYAFISLLSSQANLQSWSVPQKSPQKLAPKFRSGSIQPETPPQFSPGSASSSSSGDDPICFKLIYLSTDKDSSESQTQRSQMTLDILRCILKELRKQSESRLSIESSQSSPGLSSSGGGVGGESQYLPFNYNKLQVPLEEGQENDAFSPNLTMSPPPPLLPAPVKVDFFLNVQEVMDFDEVEHVRSAILMK